MVSAIGIAGGDLYDTLLILQALRDRFPSTVFFTTDLDARFWDPKEWAWSRNLVVVSGYGIKLERNLQGQTPPFRDSSQTAQYAAALAALGNTNLQHLKSVPVRRFEIGRNGPVDLSEPEPANSPFVLHPERPRDRTISSWLKEGYNRIFVVLALLGGMIFALLSSKYVRQFTIERHRFMAEPLWLKEEDIGGAEGFLALARKLAGNQNANTANGRIIWLRETLRSLVPESAPAGLHGLIFASGHDETEFELPQQL
jgi:hypothetical protein